MGDLDESLHPVVTHLLRRRVRPRELRKLCLQLRQLVFQQIILKIRDLRFRLTVITLIVRHDFSPKGLEFGLNFFGFHAATPVRRFPMRTGDSRRCR